jgi:hypothetical protein
MKIASCASHRGRTHIFGLLIGAAAVISVGGAKAADDKSTMSAVMELVGVSSDEEVSKIDYSERPKLVLPPSVNGLPEPRTGASRPNGWPAEMVAERGRRGDRYARVAGAEPEAKVSLMERIRGPRPTAAPGTDDEPGFLQRALGARSRSSEPVWDEPSRRMLTEPPPGYRRPTQDLSRVRDADGKKSSWWNPLSYVGGSSNSDNDPVAQTAATAPSAQAPRSGGGLLSSLGF